MKMGLEFPESEKRKLTKLMKEMEQATGAESWKVARNTARDLCHSAKFYSPSIRRGSSPRWVRPKGTRGVFVPWHRKGSPKGIARVKNATPGLVKGVWDACVGLLGGRSRASEQAYNMAKMGKKKGKTKHAIDIANQSPWIIDYDKGKNPKRQPLHIQQRSIQRVNQRMDQVLNKMGERIIKKTIGI